MEESSEDAANSLENEGKDDESELAFSVSMSTRGAKFSFPDTTPIDPLLWKEETERVAPLLKKAEKIGGGLTTHSWQAHLQSMEEYCTKILSRPPSKLTTDTTSKKAGDPEIKSFDETPIRGRDSAISMNSKIEVTSTSSSHPLSEALSGVKAQLSSQIETIKKSERLMNSRLVMAPLLEQYRSYKSVSLPVIFLLALSSPYRC
jgi:hypothetical protein